MKKRLLRGTCFLLICTLCFCTRKPTSPESYDFSGKSKPIGPLRIVDSKVKTEKQFRLDSNDLVGQISYEYYANGLLKSKKRILPVSDYPYAWLYYYDDFSNLIKEIVYEGYTTPDTVLYFYNEENFLTRRLKTNVHVTPVVQDTTLYKYDENGNLVELTYKNPLAEPGNEWREISTYSDGLLSKREFFSSGALIRYKEFKYYNQILTEEMTFSSQDLLYNRLIFYYHDGLLMEERGYIGNFDHIEGQVFYQYNSNYEIVRKKVYVPGFSSSTDHEIRYTYY